MTTYLSGPWFVNAHSSVQSPKCLPPVGSFPLPARNEFTQQHHLLRDNSLVTYNPNFLDDAQTRELIEEIGNYDFHQSHINIFGKTIPIPRLQAWVAAPDMWVKELYQDASSIHWSPNMLKVKEMVETACAVTFDYCLVNYYRNGHDSISYHNDEEAILSDGTVTPIASVSLGATRRFILRHNITKEKENSRYPMAPDKHGKGHAETLETHGTKAEEDNPISYKFDV